MSVEGGDAARPEGSAHVGHLVIRAWQVRSAPEFGPELGRLFESWAGRAGLVACWPQARIAIERRFVKPTGSERLAEYVVAAVESADPQIEGEPLQVELDRVLAPVRGRQLMKPVEARELGAVLAVADVADLAELRTLSDIAPEGAGAFANHLGEMIDALSELEAGATLSLLIATPGMGEVPAQALWDPRVADDGAVGTRPSAWVAVHRRSVRFRLRIAAGEVIPASLIASASALTQGPTATRGEGWRRARGVAELEAAREALGTLGSDAWGEPGEEALASTAAAAALLSTPTRSDKLEHLDVGMEPVRVPGSDGAAIGLVASEGGELVKARLSWVERTGHLYLAGATGTGKSTLLSHLLAEDMEAGRACVVIDPHGPLADHALGLVPEARQGDVVVLDPLEPECAGLDLLPTGVVQDPHRVASRLTNAIQALYESDYLGPRLLQVVHMATLALLERSRRDPASPATIAEVERLIADDEFRRGLIPELEDPAVREFWMHYDRQSGTSFFQSEFLMYVTSKLTPLTQGTLRHALVQPADYRLEDLIAERAIVICRFAVGELGFAAASFIGRLMLARLLDCLAANSRAGTPTEVSLILDEVQTLADGPTVERFLSQSRKFGAALAAANQHPSQLGQRTLAGVLTNCANLILFRLAEREAELFSDRIVGARERLPLLPNHHAIATRAAAHGSPFTLKGLKGEEANADLRAELRERSRRRMKRVARADRPAQDRSLRKATAGARRKWVRGTRDRRASSPRTPAPALEQLLLISQAESNIPPAPKQARLIRYWPEQHAWARRERGRVVAGIAHGAVMELGEEPEIEVVGVGREVERGDPLALIDQGAFTLLAPVTGAITAVNPALESSPGLLRHDPYNAGWVAELAAPNWRLESRQLPRGLDGADAYRRLLAVSGVGATEG